MSMIMVKSFAVGLAGPLLESKFAPDLGAGSLGLPKLFGVTPLVLTGISFWALLHGFTVVGQSRKKFIEMAKKDGEKDVEERYDLPNLYAQGTSKHAKAFNCIQRSHQHIFETFPYFCMVSILGAVHYPIMAALGTVTYGIGRLSLSNGYATSDGDATKRYSGSFGWLLWYGLITNIVLSVISCVSFVAGKPIL
jgi:hypothetical protein